MDQASLVDRMVKAGEDLIRYLDKTPFPVQTALWFYFPEAREWKLILASPYVDEFGPLASYKAIHKAIDDLGRDYPLGVADITVISPDDELVQALGHGITAGPDVTGIRITNNVLDGTVVDDAYIYRLPPKPQRRSRETAARGRSDKG